MYKIKCKNLILSSIMVILGILSSVALTFLDFSHISINVPVYLIGSFGIIIVLNLFIHAKASAIQTIYLSLVNFILFYFISILPIFLLKIAKITNITLISHHNILINPAIIAISLLFSVIFTKIFFSFEPIKIIKPAAKEKQNISRNKAEVIEEKIDIIEQETVKEINQEIEISHQIDQNNDYTDEIFELGELPDITLNTSSMCNIKKDLIPVNIRLAETSKPKNVSSQGVISSISKLLVNQRDIENIIQVNELMQNIGCDSSGTHVISLREGSKIYEKFNKIMVEYNELKDFILLDKAGFILASTFTQINGEQNTGAIAVVAFLVLQNYLDKISVYPTKIFFQTDDVCNVIFEIDNQIQFFNCSKDFSPIILEENIFELDLENIKGLNSAVISEDGINISEYHNCIDPDELLSLGCAVFENLKVFITNIQPSKLNTITIMSNDSILVINKNNEKISVLIFENECPVKLSQKIIEVDNILKQGIIPVATL